MAISLKQKVGNNANSNAATGTLSMGNTTTGDTMLVFINVGNTASGNVSSVTDSQSNSYTKVFSYFPNNLNGSESEMLIYEADSITGGTTPTITVHFANTGNECQWFAYEYSGLAASALDKTNNATNTSGTSSALNSGASGTTSQASELIIGFGASGNGTGQTYTVGSGYGDLLDEITSTQDSAVEDEIVSATGSYTATFTLGSFSYWQCVVATFKGAGGGGPTPGNDVSMWGHPVNQPSPYQTKPIIVDY